MPRHGDDPLTQIIIHYTRYSTYDPNHWWQTRDGTRTEIVELEKLLLDVAGTRFPEGATADR